MIQEDYVNFEVAKLLKEKGFDEGCFRYAENKEIYESGNWTVANVTGGGIGVPTLQMAMKWLREEKRIFIAICHCTYPREREVTWIPEISTFDSVFPDSAIEYDTYEEASEASIKYCLENLI